MSMFFLFKGLVSLSCLTVGSVGGLKLNLKYGASQPSVPLTVEFQLGLMPMGDNMVAIEGLGPNDTVNTAMELLAGEHFQDSLEAFFLPTDVSQLDCRNFPSFEEISRETVLGSLVDDSDSDSDAAGPSIKFVVTMKEPEAEAVLREAAEEEEEKETEERMILAEEKRILATFMRFAAPLPPITEEDPEAEADEDDSTGFPEDTEETGSDASTRCAEDFLSSSAMTSPRESVK